MSRAGAVAGAVSGLAALGAAAAALAAGALAPAAADGAGPTAASAASSTASGVVVPASTTRLVCPDGASAAASTSTTAHPRTAASTADGLALPAGGSSAPLAASDLVATATTAAGASGRAAVARALASGAALAVAVPGTTGGSLAAAPAGGVAPLLAGQATSRTASGALRGLTSTSCLEPATDSWLVGGTLGTGRSLRLELVDAGEAATTVSVTVLTASGPQQPAALQAVALAAGQRTSVLLQGVVTPGSGPIAVRVQSSGAPVAAWTSEVVADGLTPGGTDVVVPAAAPARTQLVTGLASAAGQGDPVLRLAAPGTGTVVAHVSVLGSSGSLALAQTATTVAVPGGRAVDVPLHGLGASAAAVSVTADGPVVAGLALTTGTDGTTTADTAWAAAEPALAGTTLVALPPVSSTSGVPLADSRLVLAAAPGGGDGAVDVRVVGADGALGPAQRTTLAAGRTTSLALAPLATSGASSPLGLQVTAVTGQVGAALVSEVPGADGSRTGDLLAVRPLRSPARAAGSVAVRLSGAP